MQKVDIIHQGKICVNQENAKNRVELLMNYQFSLLAELSSSTRQQDMKADLLPIVNPASRMH